MQEFYFDGCTTGGEDMIIELRVRCFGGVFYIQYSPETIKAPRLLEQHLQFLHIFEAGDGSEVARQLKKPFEPLMAKLAPEVEQSASYRLSEYLYPQHFVLEATASTEDTAITPRFRESITGQDLTPPGDYLLRGSPLAILELEKWAPSIYSSNQILLVSFAPSLERDIRLSGPKKVLARDEPCFFKKWRYSGSPPGANHRELHTYKRIQMATALGQIRPDLRISRLHGVVVDEDNETFICPDDDDDKSDTSPGRRLVGVLLTFIETKKQGWMGTLSNRVLRGDCSQETISRWTRELDLCVADLHQAGIVWGDVKPDNILVDKIDNIWAIDFGGGYTIGWVDEEKCETMEGDLQGVGRIKGFLALRNWLKEVEGKCGICYVNWHLHGRKEDYRIEYEHGTDKCRVITKQEYLLWRKGVNFAKGSCCWNCGLPERWCRATERPEKARTGECMSMDQVLPVVMLSGRSGRLGNIVQDEFEKDANADEYRSWLGRATRLYGEDMTNALAVWDTIVQKVCSR